MDNYKKQCPIDGGTCGQGGTCFVCENESLGAELAAAKARIAELEKALELLDQVVCQVGRAITSDLRENIDSLLRASQQEGGEG